MTTEVHIQPTSYTVSMLPDGHIDQSVWSLKIDYTAAPGTVRQWAVRHIGQCLSRTGKWVYEPTPSSRTATFIKRHRFTLDEAMAAATREIPKLKINGYTSADILAKDAS